jgi:hypothetical protein
MAGEEQNAVSIFDIKWQAGTVALALVVTFAATVIAAPAAQAQTFSVLHYFTGGLDGAGSTGGVTVGPSGVLYGTAAGGGPYGEGTVFKLIQVHSIWVLYPLFEFDSGDGDNPIGGVVFGPNGALYGTTFGSVENQGTVFQMRPPLSVCKAFLCYWNETVLHTFTGAPDGADPQAVNLVFDQAGNIYGTTQGGGMYGGGTTFELTPSGGGGYTASILHNFGNGTDGNLPYSGVVLDRAGNVYGTTAFGGTGTPEECGSTCGTVYQLMPSNGGWVENVLVDFDGTNGRGPYGNLIIDASGNLYGTTDSGGQIGGNNGDGVVFKLAPSGGGFTYSELYTFSSCNPVGGVVMNASGNFFGVCATGGAHQDGWIFELTNCSQTCGVSDLHDFSGSDGAEPEATPVLDANGNLYGTTVEGGIVNDFPCYEGCGVVWEITP